MPPPSALEPGATVGGKYRLLRRIGVGGMGEVWAARNCTTDAEVAVKLGLGSAAREDAAQRFRHEARLGAMLAHRSIVRIFDLVEESDRPLVLVMELLKGETLERHLRRRGPLPAPEAIAIVVPILSALAHAHATGIVHRDLTPANVFLALDPDGHVTPKLLDFGIAKIPATAPMLTIDGRALGTPRYMAPERIRDKGPIDGRSDLFSVGVVLYELLTGVCPFAAGSAAASLAAVLEVVVDPDPRIDPRVGLELRRALSKRPYERPPTATAMADGLLAVAGQTEATLVEVLRGLPLSPGPAEDELDPAHRAQTAGGHSLSVARGLADALAVRPRKRTVAWVAGSLGVCALLLAYAIASPGGKASATRPPPSPTEELAARAPPAASPPGLPSQQPSATSSVPSTTASARQPPARSAPPPRPRPVATTPGF
jgi:serine/threonine protein kinase